MLTFDDLDHFDDRTYDPLFEAPATPGEQARLERRQRILACLLFCQEVPADQLPQAGLASARRTLRRLRRSLQRERFAASPDTQAAVDAALHALGGLADPGGEGEEAAALRHLVEREIEEAAHKAAEADSAVPQLLGALADGDFEITPASRLGALEQAVGGRSRSAEVAIDFFLDTGSFPVLARVALALECGVWRWRAEAAGVVFDARDAMELEADDPAVEAILAGLALRNGRTIVDWHRAVGGAPA